MVVRGMQKRPSLAPDSVLTGAATSRLRVDRLAPARRRVAVFYCRYSSKEDREESIDRQKLNNRTYAHRHGFTLLDQENYGYLYIDRSVSAGYLFDRPEFQRMIEDARAGKFEIVVFEDVDRFSRNLGDLAKLHEELKFCGVEMHAALRGLITNIEVALLGFLFSEQRTKIINLTTQGRWQAAEKGRHPGSACFGYYTEPGAPGELIVDPATSLAVRWAFEWYDAGAGCDEIAARLDAADISPPRGSKWNANTLRGCAGLGTGLLRNLKYKGVQAYGKIERRRHPVSGKWIVTVRDPTVWRIVAVPEWKIVEPELFDRVQRKLAENTIAPRRSPLEGEPHLFRGVSFCVCGAPMRGHLSGSKRSLSCSAAPKDKCTHRGKILLRPVEQEILRAVRHHLVSPEAEAAFDATFRSEWAAAVKRIELERRRLNLAIQHTERRLLVTLDEKKTKGMTPPRVVRMRMLIETKLNEYESALQRLPARASIERLPDGCIGQFRAQVDRLIEGPPSSMNTQPDRDLLAALCGVVGRLEMRVHRRGCDVRISGHLAGLYGSDIAVHMPAQHIELTVRRQWYFPGRRDPENAISVAYDGSSDMNEDDWAAVSRLFPRRRRHALTTRRVVNAALHHARTGIPVYSLPADFGQPSALAKAIRTIRRSNALASAVDVLARRSSASVAGIDLARVMPKPTIARRPAGLASRTKRSRRGKTGARSS